MHARKSARQYTRALSDRESKILVTLSYAGKTIFTTEDIKEYTNNPKDLLDYLTRKRWVLKIRKGVYAIVPFEAGEQGAASYTMHSFVIASLLVKPYYIGYWSALNYHGLTDQTPPAVYVATTKLRHSRKILDTQLRFVTIPVRKMFGVDEIEIEKRKVMISSPEKTVADCLDHPEHCGGIEEVAKALYFAKDEIDFGKIVQSAQRLGNSAVLKRLVYVAWALKLEKLSELLTSVKVASGYSLLDPTMPKSGHKRERWKLILNVEINSSGWTR